MWCWCARPVNRMCATRRIWGAVLKSIILSLSLASILIGDATAQQSSDPIYWCNVSRAQVSQERDASLAMIEALKTRNAALEAKVKELEVAKKE